MELREAGERSLRKGIQNHKHKIGYEQENLLLHETTTNYILKRADKYRKHREIPKDDNVMFLLICCLTHLCDMFPTLLASRTYFTTSLSPERKVNYPSSPMLDGTFFCH